MTEGRIRTYQDWTFQWRPAEAEPKRLLLLIHGLSGDEHSMWIFTQHLPKGYAVLAPRALFPAQPNGYTWRTLDPARQGLLPNAGELKPAAEALIGLVDEWCGENGMDCSQFDAAGFSQGTALTYLLAILYPLRVRKFAALSGFIPEGAEGLLEPGSFEEKRVFVSHNRQDEMVPVEKARQAVGFLEEAGAQVAYCENDGAHKVSKDCMAGLKEFFASA